MKKSEFYLRHKNGFYKVAGYIDTIEDNAGNKHIIGFHCEHKKIGWWVATHVKSGLAITHGKTRKDCLEKVKSEKVLKSLNESTKTEQVKEYIEQMNNFLNTGVIDSIN